ncbi:hypothetical protein [Terrabacter sp. 2YAF2]|uniref:hypothetical protein n=1 Tax=Terrabacter sp. 2YAF2 TaxID=3233026 RepID=UPI003F979BC9
MNLQHASSLTRIRAVLASPTLYRLAAALEPERPVGRPPANPVYVTLAYGVLARVLRSGVRVQLDLHERHTWTMVRALLEQGLAASGVEAPPPGLHPPTWDHWRWLRDQHLATDEGLARLGEAFPPLAVRTARDIGLLLPHGPGSLTHPDPTRCVYGDGTLVRPLYRPPQATTVIDPDGSTHLAYPHPRTGELLEHPAGRYDPDLREHHGQLGPVLTHGYVFWHARGPGRYQRVVLGADHIPEPGTEAVTALGLLGRVHQVAGDGIQAAVYDGAMNGIHIDQVMTRYGYLLLAKQPTGAPGDAEQVASLVLNDAGRRVRSYPLGTVSHPRPPSRAAPDRAPCRHQLAAIGGRVVDVGLDETGDPVVLAELDRGPVKRFRRTNGSYHFNIGYHLHCPEGEHTVWLTPHAADGDPRRPQNLRVIPETDPDFPPIIGLRSDAEGFHSNLKRTLLVNRAMCLGWRRGLVEVYCFSLLNNALTEALANAEPARTHARRTTRRRTRPEHQPPDTAAAR